MSADIFGDAVQLGAAMAASYSMLMIGRGIAARIAGQNAAAVLGMALVSVSFGSPLPRRRGDEDNDEIAESTRYAGAPEYAEVRQSTPELMQVNEAAGSYLTPRISDEEKAGIETARRNAIVLLTKCINYYKEHPAEIDNGIIPPHSDLHMGSDNRREAVNALWESGMVTKGNKGTFINSDVAASCAELFQHIKDRDPKYRVYPLGYFDNKKELLDSAVMDLPAHDA